MIKRVALAAVRVGRSQILGVGAQVLGAAPVIVMSIYLAHGVGLAAVADYAMLIGVSAVVYTLGVLGLRTRLVLDRFRAFAEDDYYAMRIIAAALMAAVVLLMGPFFQVPLMLALAVALMRSGDAALDLVMAVDQVRRDERKHLYGYIIGSSVKLALLLGFLLIGEVSGLLSPFLAFALSSGLYAAYAWWHFVKRRESRGALFGAGRAAQLLRLLRFSVAFAIAQILCSLLTSAPRIALTSIADRELAGAAAAALSVATLIGMTYFAVWLRWLPRFGVDRLRPANVMMFIAEITAALVLVLGAIWLVGRPAMALVYGISAASHLDMTLWTLASCAIFFFFMTLANLFKPTRLPWAESAVYIGGLCAIFLAFGLKPGTSIPTLLLVGALGMALIEILSLAALIIRRRLEGLT